jgi:ComF family protein
VNGIFSLIDFTFDLLAPNVCSFCGDFVNWNSYACESCKKAIVSMPLREPPQFCEKVFSAFLYNELGKAAIYRLKYKHNPAPALLAAGMITQSDGFDKNEFDLLVPVPMHRSQLYSRYYNPADIFAKRIRRHTGIPVSSFALAHEKTGTKQHHLSERERAENAEKVYSVNRADEIKGKRILLCDDVITTGATIGVCAKLLITAGAESVSAAVCASSQKKQKKAS